MTRNSISRALGELSPDGGQADGTETNSTTDISIIGLVLSVVGGAIIGGSVGFLLSPPYISIGAVSGALIGYGLQLSIVYSSADSTDEWIEAELTPSPTSDQIDDLRRELEDLREKVENDASSDNLGVRVNESPRGRGMATLPDTLVGIMASNPYRTFTLNRLSNILHEYPESAVESNLRTLVQEGKVIRVNEYGWTLDNEYFLRELSSSASKEGSPEENESSMGDWLEELRGEKSETEAVDESAAAEGAAEEAAEASDSAASTSDSSGDVPAASADSGEGGDLSNMIDRVAEIERELLERESSVVMEEEVTVVKWIDTTKFETTAIVLQVSSEKDDPISVRVVEKIPDEIGMDNVGFHPEFGGEDWELIGNNQIAFQRRLEPKETVKTVYGIRTLDSDRAVELLSSPEVSVIDEER